MCVFRKAIAEVPKFQQLKPETAPRPEATSKAPVIGRKRTAGKRTTGSRTSGGTKAARRFGTRSLRIPLMNTGGSGSGNLNY